MEVERMQLKDAAKAKDDKTKEFLSRLETQEPYVKDGLVFQKTVEGIVFLGPLSKRIMEKCETCEFLVKHPGSDTLSEPEQDVHEVFWKGGCILHQCVEEIIRSKRHYAVSRMIGPRGKKMLKSAWKEIQGK